MSKIKPITISTKQSKLLAKMTISLIPKLRGKTTADIPLNKCLISHFIDSRSDQDHKFIQISTYNRSNDWWDFTSFHWFELCWILANKIVEKQKLSPLQMLNFITQFGQVCFNRFPDGHPVDFLYEQFKRKK